jgi:hypothetical protein
MGIAVAVCLALVGAVLGDMAMGFYGGPLGFAAGLMLGAFGVAGLEHLNPRGMPAARK